MDNVTRFSVSLPNSLFDALDERLEIEGYSSRSEFIRDMIREKIVKDRWTNAQDLELIGILTLIYAHHQTDLLAKIMELEHHADIHIICKNHIHIDHDNCLETLSLKGSAEKIEKFCAKIKGLKGVKFAELTRASTLDA